MGIIIGDTITMSTGQTATNAYSGFGNEELRITKNVNNGTTTYICIARASVYISESSKNNGSSHITVNSVSVSLTSSQLTCNIYEKLYTEYKKQFTSTTDVL